jgi:pyridinium-3,5-biscarboxylic acid mononucleotide sulfurtransferase
LFCGFNHKQYGQDRYQENAMMYAFKNLEDPALRAKGEALYRLLRGMGGLAVAFSGGVDSALVAVVGHAALGDHLIAVTVRSPVETPGDAETASRTARQAGFRHVVVDFDDFSTPHFAANPPERCYHCKLARLTEIRRLAAGWGITHVAEGSNADDAADYRPGSRAVAELGIRSPLAEVGLRKSEIRALAHALGLEVWDRPSAPCLATRFPYGTRITARGLDQIAQGEAFLRERGFSPVRVRHFGDTARLEVSPSEFGRLALERDTLLPFFKSIGFTYVVADLAGYRSGSMNETLGV